MHTFVEQALRGRQQRPRDNHDRRGAVPRLNVLRIRQVHHLHAAVRVRPAADSRRRLGSNHLRGGVLHFHALDNGGAVIRDDDVAAGRDDLRQARLLAKHHRAAAAEGSGGRTILSMPFGPRLVRTASAMARAAVMLLCLTVLPRVFCSLLSLDTAASAMELR